MCIPRIPPLPQFKVTRDPIWITAQNTGPYQVLLQARPSIPISITTWYDHWCEVFYVPILKNATSVAIPSWVYTAQAA